MKRTLYALLVGINGYPNPRHRLSGCLNDVARMREYLEGRFDGSAFQLALAEPLTDAKATRQAVIDAFQNHLSQAKKGDVALFYFSGHGSQERAPKNSGTSSPISSTRRSSVTTADPTTRKATAWPTRSWPT